MKKYFLAPLLAAACCSALSAGPAPAQPTENPFPPEVRLALDTLQKEYDARFNPPKGQTVRADQPSAAGYTDAQKAALHAVFGTEDALDVKRLPGKGRMARYAVRIPGHTYDHDGVHSEWTDAALQVTTGATGDDSSVTGAWPGVDVRGRDHSWSIHDINIGGRQLRDAATGVKLGDAHLKAGRITINDDSSPTGTHLLAEGTGMQISVGKQGRKIDQKIDILTRQLTAGTARIDDLHVAFRLRDLNAAALKKFEDATKARSLSTATDAERGAAAVADMGQMFKTLILQGGSLEISDISAGNGGNRFQIKGSVSMPGAAEQDLASAATVLNKLQARFDIKLPPPMLRNIAHGFAQMGNKGKAEDADLEKNIYQLFLGKALSEGYARLEKDLLVSVVELQDGKLRINGKELEFSVAGLLEQWNKHTPPPPEDHGVPVEVSWHDRKLESVELFAGNGTPEAIRELCRRRTSGDGAAEDSADTLKWCALSEEQSRKDAEPVPEVPAPAATEPDDARTFHYHTAAGYYQTDFFRFDESRSRTLEVTLTNPREHEKWAPMASLCLTAEAPSDTACLSLSRVAKGTTQIRAATSLLSTSSDSRKEGQKLEQTMPLGEPVRVKVFVRDGKARFLVNDEELEQEVVFPVELIQLTCSTGDCTFKFD